MITQSDVIYFVLTDRFFNGDKSNDQNTTPGDPRRYHGGDFAGIIKKIPYLKDLGITALWITPVYLSVGTVGEGDVPVGIVGKADGYHGYWALDFEKVDPHLYTHNPALAAGSKRYLKEFVDELHKNHIKVILDMVVNHTGYHNAAYKDYPDKVFKDDWFNRNGSGEIKGELSGLPDLNHDMADVRDYFVNNILSWIEETGIDAIRMDTVKHVEKAFWYFFKSYIRGKHSGITLIGEVLEKENIANIAQYQANYDFDTLFDFPLCTKIKETLVYGGGMTAIAKLRLYENEERGILDYDTVYYNNANRLVTMLDNHDMPCRIKTEIIRNFGRGAGKLTNQVLKLCLTFLFTTRGIPKLYYGTEIGMEGDEDPHNRRDMRWDVFTPNPNPHPDDLEYAYGRDVFAHTKLLIKIRKENPAFYYGYLFTLYVDHFIYAFMREYKGNIIIVVINNGIDPMPFPLEIKIRENSKIPIRIKDQLDGKKLVNQLNPSDKLDYMHGVLMVKLNGKEGRIYRQE